MNRGNSQPSTPQVPKMPDFPKLSRAGRIRLWIAIGIIFVVYLILQFGINLYTDYLWFQHLNLESVFVTSFWAKILSGLVVAIPFAIILWINAFIARWQSVRNVLFFSEDTLVAQPLVKGAIWGGGLFLAWIVGVAASSNWLMFLRFLNQRSFAIIDPVFGMDIAFYIYTIPLFHFIQSWLLIGFFLSIIAAGVIYALAQQNNLTEGRVVLLPHVQLHLSVLGGLIFLTLAWGHWLDLFDLMYSARGVAFGASYTDINVTMPALWVMTIVAIIVALVLFANIFLRKPALSLLAIFIWIIVGIIGVGFIPNIVQRYIVEPNELAREDPYIKNNIEFTNIAYGLNDIEEYEVVDMQTLTAADIAANESTWQNIRLWDYRPLQQTYQQIQTIRPYYDFYDIDIDRYMIAGELRQVALSGRELDKSKLSSPTWVTQKLQFTHGYGAVFNPINEVTGDGLPELWVKDLPPQSVVEELHIERPELYYGEMTNDYIFVNTNEREFDYPSGDENVFAAYEGSGGVTLNGFLKRWAFALRLADLNMLLSQEFTPQSRVMLFRNVRERVNKIAPFLHYDQDPYLVIGDEGRLYWIQDAYTTSNLFPYAEPISGFNYIRNSVKVLIDPYNGSMTFYIVDKDPLIASYADIFPALFKPGSQMPAWMQAHLRYPEGLFRIQSQLYQTYHMRDVNVFYNKEDLWQIPKETFSGDTQLVEPYYVILKLPGQEKSEFVLMQPFTPDKKDNLIAWMAALSDGEHYGQLVTYRFPKQELIFGPLQIEARIDQNPEISAQISLWDQGGSEVIRGNLLVLPIEDSLLYVEPLYLQAENGQIPELKRVILASENKVVMRETLAQALVALFEGQDDQILAETAASSSTDETPPPEEAPSSDTTPTDSQDSGESSTTTTSPPTTDLTNKNIAQLAQIASDHYEAAQRALRQGDWQTYGQELDNMEAALKALVQLTATEE